jgi:hypothetical protein
LEAQAEAERLLKEEEEKRQKEEDEANDFSFGGFSFGGAEEKPALPTGDFWYRHGTYSALHYAAQESDAEVSYCHLVAPLFSSSVACHFCPHHRTYQAIHSQFFSFLSLLFRPTAHTPPFLFTR